MYDMPHLGVGLGYRGPLRQDILAHADRIDFLEFISDQYIYAPPERTDELLALRESFPLIPHGIAMSIGTGGPIDPGYLHRLAALTERVDAPWFSDHLCFTKVPEADTETLSPLWFTRESVANVRRNLSQLGAAIPRQFLLENITYYFHLPGNDMTEAEFITEVLDGTDVGLLLDVQNVWVNSVNLGFDPYAFLDAIPLERTVQVHLAGGKDVQGVLVDTHSTAVVPQVWDLLRYALERAPAKAILLEWDQDWPEFGVLLDHLDQAREIMHASRAGAAR